MTENKWRENLKETTRLITSQAFSLKITNLILELQYGLMVINFDRAHVHTHTRTHILSKLASIQEYCYRGRSFQAICADFPSIYLSLKFDIYREKFEN